MQKVLKTIFMKPYKIMGYCMKKPTKFCGWSYRFTSEILDV